jgi:hypothetical protein
MRVFFQLSRLGGKNYKRSQVQACPGATGFGYENIINFNGPGLPSLHLSISGLGQGFTVQGYFCSSAAASPNGTVFIRL